MIRDTQFRISRRPYAVDLSSLRIDTREPDGPGQHRSHRIDITAVWFRRRARLTVACIGALWDFQPDPAPADTREALTRHVDGRYGGDCRGRWDGTRYWGAQEPEEIERHLAVLRPMLENHPAIPPGYDGWWRF